MLKKIVKKNPVAFTLQVLLDMVIINFALILSKALYSHYIQNIPLDQNAFGSLLIECTVFTIVCVLTYYLFGIYNSMWRFAGAGDLLALFAATVVGTVLGSALLTSPLFKIAVHFYILLFFFFLLSLKCAVYLCYKFSIDKLKRYINKPEQDNRIMIIGAGAAGAMIVKEYINNNSIDGVPVAIIDDNSILHGKKIHGVPVVGDRNNIVSAVKKYKINEIIIAIPSAPKIESQKILNICTETKCRLKIMPEFDSVLSSNIKRNIRDVKIDDLLGREEIKINEKEDFGYIRDAVVMVTGGGGSIGSELCRQIAVAKPKKLIILDFYENNAYDIQQELIRKYGDTLNLTVVIVSVQDAVALEKVFAKYHPDVVFHAAAHKHVPLMEHYPAEAIKNNVFGTYNTAFLSSKYKVNKFILISTDKAVNPTNVMGATKRLSEMVIQNLNRKSNTKFAAVRFGNVLGSNGSVIPLFKKQIQSGGPVTVTDNRITRFFMTINEAAQLVIQAGALTQGGEVFVLDMGTPVKIIDLAKNMILLSGFKPYQDIDIVEIGLRPGEKLYEELMLEDEGISSTMYNKIYVASPAKPSFDDLDAELGKISNIINNDDFDGKQVLSKLVPTYKMKPASGKIKSAANAS